MNEDLGNPIDRHPMRCSNLINAELCLDECGPLRGFLQLVGCRHLDGLKERSIHWAVLGVHRMDPLYDLLRLRRCFQVISNMDAPYHEHFPLCFDLASDLSYQTSVARIDLARLQRATEGAGQSTTGGCHDIV